MKRKNIDLDKCYLAGFKALDLIRLASVMKNSEAWQYNAAELSHLLDPVVFKLCKQDEERISQRRIAGIPDLSRNIAERQYQKLRILQQILGWTLYRIAMENTCMKELMERFQGNIGDKLHY
jgi:hypothetical protein